MARRSDHSRSELKLLVIQATELIVKNSEPLTARNIATKIGYTVGTLYNAFKNLDDIILHVNSNTLDVLSNLLITAYRASKGERFPIKGVGLAYVAFSQADTARWQLLFEHRYAEVLLPAWYQEKVAKVFQIPENCLKESFPGFNDHLIANAAKIIWSGLHGICALSLGGKLNYVKKTEPIEQLACSFMDDYLRGLPIGHPSPAIIGRSPIFEQPVGMLL